MQVSKAMRSSVLRAEAVWEKFSQRQGFLTEFEGPEGLQLCVRKGAGSIVAPEGWCVYYNLRMQTRLTVR